MTLATSFSAQPPYAPPLLALTGRGLGQDSFAFITLRDRMPVIVTKTIDTLARFMHNLPSVSPHDDQTSSRILSELSRLRYELQCNKPLQPIVHRLPSCMGDADTLERERQAWNAYIATFEQPTWFDAPWLFTECYMYRRIAECFTQADDRFFLDHDWFGEQKQHSLDSSWPAIEKMAERVLALSQQATLSSAAMQAAFTEFLHMALWGNQVDLSLHAGKSEEHVKANTHDDHAHASQHFLLANDTDAVWKHIKASSADGDIHIVLDNSGAELFSDFCLADFFVANALCRRVIFHVKSFPWFVSDVTRRDFDSLLANLVKRSLRLAGLAERWRSHLHAGRWQMATEHLFWTTGHPIPHMPDAASELHKQLMHESTMLVIFKGDLNYRKLVYDCGYGDWTRPFQLNALGFEVSRHQWAPVLALRTAKSEVVVGLSPGQADDLTQREGSLNAWLVTGRYGLIQFTNHHRQ